MRRQLVAAAAALVLLASCATTAPAQQKKAPSWVLDTPKPDASNTYFVGQASGPIADPAGATDGAAANLIASIMQYIGVKVSVDSTATARATLDSYAAEIKQSVTTQATNRLAGFQIKEKFLLEDKKAGKVTVYVLAAYATADLEKEKRRIAAVFQEKEDAVAKPEAEGKALLEAGRGYEAVRKFVEAAVAASGSDIDNADIKLERNVNNARTALSRIRFDKQGEGYKGLLGQPFPEPFKLRLVSGEGAGAPGVAGANLLVSYQRKQGSRTVSKTESAVTDATGLLSYAPPPPDFVGKAKLVVRVDFQSSVDLLDKLPAKYEALRQALAEELRAKYVEIGYEVSSNARAVPIAVAIVDYDEAGKAVAGAQAQAGLIDALTKEKFSVRSGGLDSGLVGGMDDDAILAAAKSLLAGKAERLAYGVARLESVRKDGAMFLATAKAAVKVVELSSGRILYSAEKTATGLGADEAAARRAAYRELGAGAIGKDLLSSLP
ncbi:MAG TPA: hypothetical protein P5165_04820 [Spirochaetia bacterium]|nr:hypothetical protein [Spirochaetia bacterium]